MSIARANDPRAFRDFLDTKLSSGGEDRSLEELIGLWEYENQTDAEQEETLAAIRRGLADVEAGRTRPLEEFDREFRQKHGLTPRA